MLTPIIVVESRLAQVSPPPEPNLLKVEYVWMGVSGLLLILLIILGIFHKAKIKGFNKKLSLEVFRNKNLQQKYKLALVAIAKMEKNPDLIHSREFNLDCLRMRMEEEAFNFGIVNQIKEKVKQHINIALQTNSSITGEKRNPNDQKINSIFEVEYKTGETGKNQIKRVLFRVSIKLKKLSNQLSYQTINQIIDCLETYLSPNNDHDNWTPTIQGQIVHIDWDKKAKPVPMLVVEQFNDEVILRTNKSILKSPTALQPELPADSKKYH
ncbi:MAG: hypothetical protein O4807_13785 [Trichodesmium sp. St19_bin2]|nr:hypothetical protein [Trichodesmium sp. St19_bin2]